MKEHTLFAIVFLVFVVGFISFDSSAITGQAFENQNWPTLNSRDGTFAKTTPIRDWDNVEIVSQMSESRSYSNVLGSYSPHRLSSGFPFTGSRQRDYRISGGSLGSSDISLSDLRICLGHVLFNHGNIMPFSEVERIVRPIGLAEKCLPAKKLDIDGNGHLSRQDEKAYQTMQRGLDTEAFWKTYANFIPCSQLGERQYFAMYGGEHECVEAPLGYPVSVEGVFTLLDI